MGEVEGGIVLHLKVKPKSRRNCIEGLRAGALLVQVTAAPDRGEANRAVVETLADWLDVAKSHIEIVSGHTSRDKTVRVDNLTKQDFLKALTAKIPVKP